MAQTEKTRLRQFIEYESVSLLGTLRYYLYRAGLHGRDLPLDAAAQDLQSHFSSGCFGLDSSVGFCGGFRLGLQRPGIESTALQRLLRLCLSVTALLQLFLEKSTALADSTYQAAVRMRLDLSLLPKPFQVNALTSREWHLESEWRRFSWRPGSSFR